MGGSGDDVMDGKGGADEIDGGIGNDYMKGGRSGGSEGDVLSGGGGADVLLGSVGDDLLLGGAGNDKLRGRAGADHFAFQATVHDFGRNRIVDFQDGRGKIDLSAFPLNYANFVADAVSSHNGNAVSDLSYLNPVDPTDYSGTLILVGQAGNIDALVFLIPIFPAKPGSNPGTDAVGCGDLRA